MPRVPRGPRGRLPYLLAAAGSDMLRSNGKGFGMPGVLWRRSPHGDRLPLVLDSPQSGTVYPDDFGFCCPLPVLRRAEDAYVDELYEAAPALGATLIGAL